MNICDNFLGEEPTMEKKRWGRKPKKQSEKSLLNTYFSEYPKEEPANSKCDDSKEPGEKLQRPYENIKYMSQKDKSIFENKFSKPKNKNQEQYEMMLKNKNKKIIVATGPAGTGKTMFGTEYGVKNFLTGKYDKLIFTRPSVSVDEDLGYLPGNLEEKMAPWVRPIYDILYQFLSPKEISAYMEEKSIEIAPLGYMRGRTFKNAWLIADEMQNSTVSQMKMLMTRLGENSRLVITGDLEQYDKPETTNGLEDFLDKFKGKRSSSITSLEFDKTDILREDVVKEVLEIYSGECIPSEYMEE
jgi:phosphate starvation-inducible protein PhoH and related proteins